MLGQVSPAELWRPHYPNLLNCDCIFHGKIR
jgi:hypothetical protein